MMESLKKLTMLLLIAVYMIFSVGCSNEDANQGNYAQAANIAAAENTEEANTATDKVADETIKTLLDNKEDQTTLNIRIQANGKTVIFELNDSSAAESLYGQLPMTIEVENYSNNEKIFYPDKKLDTSDTPLADAKEGTLAYYAPWGDVVMFYGDFGSASGLYELGYVVSGGENIASLSGTIKIEQY